MVHCIYLGVTGYEFKIKIVFLSKNSVDSDEMSHYASLFAKVHI